MTTGKTIDTAAIFDRFNSKTIRTPSGATLRQLPGDDGEIRIAFTSRATKDDLEKHGMTLAEIQREMSELFPADAREPDDGEPRAKTIDPQAIYRRWNSPKTAKQE